MLAAMCIWKPAMNNINKRPKLVLVILVWFVYSGLYGMHQFYEVVTGALIMPEGYTYPTVIESFLQSFLQQFLYMVAAILLFFKVSASRWLFLIMLILFIPSMLYGILSRSISESHMETIIIVGLITFIFYALITRYTFKLAAANYYVSSNK